MRWFVPLTLLVACDAEPLDKSDDSDRPEDVAGPTDPSEPGTGVDDDVSDWLDLPATLWDYDRALPDHAMRGAQTADNTPANNPITDAGATLGRVLFWDAELSQNRAIACASCHAPEVGFADDLPFSHGFEGGLTGRKSMPLVNVRFYAPGRMFWDERADTLEDQVLMPIQDGVEMGLTLDELEQRVETAPYYGPLFEDAYGDDDVSADRIGRALAQFVRSMTSFESAWDEGLADTPNPGMPFANYTAEENRGKAIFFGQTIQGAGPLCAGCHVSDGVAAAPGGPPPPPPSGAFLYPPGPRVNGLVDPTDGGIGDRTGQPGDVGRFKSPSLRNVELRAPYMHDGRFDTLEQVVDFYDSGIADVPNLDPLLRDPNTGGPIRLNLSASDKAALVAFLKTLTDVEPAFDARFSDPFN